MDNRGVSEVLSFVLTFAVLFSSVLLVGVAGFGAIQDHHDYEQLNNAEEAMEAFGNNINDIVRNGGVNHRSGELALRGGTVTPGAAGTELNVSIRGGDEPWNSTDTFSEDVGAFTYESDGDTIAYEGGAVFRGSGDASVPRTDPMITVRDDTVLISLVVIAESNQAIQSPSGVEFDIRETNSERVYVEDVDVAITVGEDSAEPNAVGWERYFDAHDDWNWDESDGRAVPNGGTSAVSVDIVEVEIDY